VTQEKTEAPAEEKSEAEQGTDESDEPLEGKENSEA